MIFAHPISDILKFLLCHLVSPVPFFILPISYSLWNKFQIAVHSETHIFGVHHCNQMPSLMVLCLVRIFPVPIFKLIAISLIGSQITNFNGSAAILTFAVFFLLQVILIPEFKIWYKLCSELDDLCVNLQVPGYVHVSKMTWILWARLWHQVVKMLRKFDQIFASHH